jgi:hypothetical protein
MSKFFGRSQRRSGQLSISYRDANRDGLGRLATIGTGGDYPRRRALRRMPLPTCRTHSES